MNLNAFTWKESSSWLRSTQWISWQREATPSTERTISFFWKGRRTRLIGAKRSFWAPILLSESPPVAPQDKEALATPGITYGQELITAVELKDAWYACKTASTAAFCWCALTENLFVMARTQGIPRDLASSNRRERTGFCCDKSEWLYRGILWDRLCTRTIRSVFRLRSRIPIHSSSLKWETSLFRSCSENN